MPTFKPKDKVFYKGREAQIVSLSPSGKSANIIYRGSIAPVYTTVRVGSLSSNPPTEKGR